MTTTQVSTRARRAEPATRGDTVGDVNRDTVDLAVWVQQSFRSLARRNAHYAAVLANRSGVRLASHVVAGDVADVTEHGRAALFRALDLVCRALDVEQGLDTNEFRDRLARRGSCLEGT